MNGFLFTNDDNADIEYIVFLYDDCDFDVHRMFRDIVWPIFSDKPFQHAHLNGWRVTSLGPLND